MAHFADKLSDPVNVHLIAIGGSAMHNLAIALHRKGFSVTGSDDEIVEPSRSRLKACGLLPEVEGWDPDLIHAKLDAVIVGMHARKDNPELLKAQQLNLKIYSYPEYLFEQTREKTRVVIGGSHGKTSITAMILHVLAHTNIDADYMVGAQLTGFDCMVRLTESAGIAVLEGDEYLSSPTDLRPKFHLYRPHIALISGIAWDHINVFPSFENYVEQFRIFRDCIMQNGTLVYCEEDEEVKKVASGLREDVSGIPYSVHPHEIRNGQTVLITTAGEVAVKIFGAHNLQNISGALEVCRILGVKEEDFYRAIGNFSGAARRLELVRQSDETVVYKDFAHSPSKLKATTQALKEQFPNRRLVACMELHTFSSLNADFLNQYEGSMGSADVALVYFNPHTIAHKKLTPITREQVAAAFAHSHLEVFTSSEALTLRLKQESWNQSNLLLMTSGNFDGVDMQLLAEELLASTSGNAVR